jgi:hypothetical protein
MDKKLYHIPEDSRVAKAPDQRAKFHKKTYHTSPRQEPMLGPNTTSSQDQRHNTKLFNTQQQSVRTDNNNHVEKTVKKQESTIKKQFKPKVNKTDTNVDRSKYHIPATDNHNNYNNYNNYNNHITRNIKRDRVGVVEPVIYKSHQQDVTDGSEKKYLINILIPNDHSTEDKHVKQSIGFTNDSRVLKEALLKDTDEIDINIIYSDYQDNVAELMAGKRIADINLFINNVNNFKFLKYGKRNWLLCNHEVFLHVDSDVQIKKMMKIDVVFCKTQAGVEWVKRCKEKYGFRYKIHYINFTTNFTKTWAQKNSNLAIHTAGQHHWKQTGTVLECWYDHKDLPPIVITCFQSTLDRIYEKGWIRPEVYKAACEDRIKNVTLHTRPIPYNELVKLKNEAGVHVCVSMIEGFGHIINESRICGAVTITTNAPPMNELIGTDCGILVNYIEPPISKRNGTVVYRVDPEDLYEAMKWYMNASDEQRNFLGYNGYQRFLSDRRDYFRRMKKIQKYILSGFSDDYDPFDS